MSYTELLSQVIFSAGVRIFLAEADTTTIAIFLPFNFKGTFIKAASMSDISFVSFFDGCLMK
jgi:hypothetical protein